jgi:hypothetical protein
MVRRGGMWVLDALIVAAAGVELAVVVSQPQPCSPDQPS